MWGGRGEGEGVFVCGNGIKINLLMPTSEPLLALFIGGGGIIVIMSMEECTLAPPAHHSHLPLN